ncbi:hypothetical protein [Candidatus Absconditicoccus praedator]|uniref:hypothetical protein n=1 Tax=Candidatus Absconditicoccus praedator TaxID=2735562 RepID=UPI001E543C84|nr:hypothetical protein [Candidatus Absconditicoccus praedator]UFX82604.1 hypothetical protein HLG78_00425 [Candidatus Absconditicoccus praedator]
MEKDIKYNTIVELINEELDYNISKIKSLEEFIKKDKNDLPNNLSDASIRASYFYQFIKLNNWTNYKVDLRTYEKNDFYYYLKYYDYMEKLLNEANKIKNFDKTKEPEKFIYFYEKSFSDLYSEFFDELKKGGLV